MALLACGGTVMWHRHTPTHPRSYVFQHNDELCCQYIAIESHLPMFTPKAMIPSPLPLC